MAKINREPGMDDAQAQRDRQGWETTVDMVTGKGMTVAANDMAGMEVGSNYDRDPLGEEYMPVTYPATEPDWAAGAAPTPDASQPRKTNMGATIASAPTTVTETGKNNS